MNGLNAKGIFVELNSGKPSTRDDVDYFFKNTQSAISVTIGVADKNEARSYEWCYDGVRRGDVMTEDGLMVSTNHYVNDGWPYPMPDDETSWNSISRRRNLICEAEEYKAAIDAEKMKVIMGRSLEDGGPMSSLTRYQIVAVPEDMVLYVYAPFLGRWAELEMSDFMP